MKATIKQLACKAFGAVIPAVLPPIHIFILYRFWGRYSRHVDKRYCSCSCWDTVFKGTYESGIASYKHVYFNATFNTVKIWLITVVSIILLYEACKFQIRLVCELQVRFLMLILFLSSLFAHYYTWWVYVNYWNDDFYVQWNHQLFFTLTELVSTLLVLHLSNAKTSLTPKKVVLITSIAMVHILAGGWDQFIENVVWGEGYAHQVVRDVSFMIPDILHVVFPLIELIRSRRRLNYKSEPMDLRKDSLFMISIITFGFSVSYFL